MTLKIHNNYIIKLAIQQRNVCPKPPKISGEKTAAVSAAQCT